MKVLRHDSVYPRMANDVVVLIHDNGYRLRLGGTDTEIRARTNLEPTTNN